METVRIGNQEWTARNLDIVVPDSWDYGDDPANREKYGRLYTWEAAKKAVESLGDGWRLPNGEDWDALIEAVGGKGVAGTKLKAKSGWDADGNGTDDYGFSALPNGGRNTGGGFWGVGSFGYWWTATESNSNSAWYRSMHYVLVRDSYDMSNGFSARCLRD